MKNKSPGPYESLKHRLPVIHKILSKYLDEKQIEELPRFNQVKTKKLSDKTLVGKFNFYYTEFEDGSYRLKISASKKSGLIRNDSVCTEAFIDKQTLVFDSPLNFNNAIAKQLKKDIKAFFKGFKQSNSHCCEED
jgi:hypothetical protein